MQPKHPGVVNKYVHWAHGNSGHPGFRVFYLPCSCFRSCHEPPQPRAPSTKTRCPHRPVRVCPCPGSRGPRRAMALHTNEMPRAEMLPRYLPQNPTSNATETRATRRITRLPAYGPATTALATPKREQARFIDCACSIGGPCTNAHAPGSVIIL